MKEFLIVKTSSIGDVIQTFSLISYLRKRFPKCQIDWIVEKEISPLMQAHPHLDRVLEIDTKKWRKSPWKYHKEVFAVLKKLRQKKYDALFDLQGNIKSGIITTFARAHQKVGYTWHNLPEKPNYIATNVHIPVTERNTRNRYLQLVQDYFGDDEKVEIEPLSLKLSDAEESRLERLGQLCFQRPRLMVCFGSNWRNKMLTEETLINFLSLIHEKLSPAFFFIYGNEKEKEIADRLELKFANCSHAVGELSLPLWQRFMQLCEGVISMDSAALHLCATTKTPSFSLFGPSSAEAYKPVGQRHYAFQGSCPYDVQFDKRCPHLRSCLTGACLREQPAEKLFAEFDRFWAKISEELLVLQ